MRQVKASEVKPGMEIEIVTTRKITVDRVFTWDDSDWELRDDSGHFARVNSDAKITVLAEPQSEEPTEFGARVVVDGGTALRTQDAEDEVDPDEGPWRVRSGRNTWDDMTWAEVCALGPVTVIPDQGWTVPDDSETAPVVPDLVMGWPEDDEYLRAHEWLDRLGSVWRYENAGATTGWSCPGMSPQDQPWGSPFTRVTDA